MSKPLSTIKVDLVAPGLKEQPNIPRLTPEKHTTFHIALVPPKSSFFCVTLKLPTHFEYDSLSGVLVNIYIDGDRRGNFLWATKRGESRAMGVSALPEWDDVEKNWRDGVAMLTLGKSHVKVEMIEVWDNGTEKLHFGAKWSHKFFLKKDATADPVVWQHERQCEIQGREEEEGGEMQVVEERRAPKRSSDEALIADESRDRVGELGRRPIRHVNKRRRLLESAQICQLSASPSSATNTTMDSNAAGPSGSRAIESRPSASVSTANSAASKPGAPPRQLLGRRLSAEISSTARSSATATPQPSQFRPPTSSASASSVFMGLLRVAQGGPSSGAASPPASSAATHRPSQPIPPSAGSRPGDAQSSIRATQAGPCTTRPRPQLPATNPPPRPQQRNPLQQAARPALNRDVTPRLPATVTSTPNANRNPRPQVTGTPVNRDTNPGPRASTPATTTNAAGRHNVSRHHPYERSTPRYGNTSSVTRPAATVGNTSTPYTRPTARVGSTSTPVTRPTARVGSTSTPIGPSARVGSMTTPTRPISGARRLREARQALSRSSTRHQQQAAQQASRMPVAPPQPSFMSILRGVGNASQG